MRKLTNEQLEKLFEKVGGYVDYWWLYKNDEWAFDALFENMIDAVRAAQYGDYDYTKPYFKVNDNDGSLYSMSEDEYFKELREGKDDLLQIYDKLVKDGDIEDFLNLSEDEDEDEFLAMLKDNKDELMEAYDDLVSDGCIEDFLNEED